MIVPPFLPDPPEVRSDILDYYFATQRYDRDVRARGNDAPDPNRFF